MSNKQHWQDWLIVLAGLWLIAVPFVINPTVPEGASATLVTWNFVLSGIVAIVLGGAALASYRLWEEGLNFILGLWVVISPWILSFATSPQARWNAVVTGLVIILAAGWNLIAEQQTGHHA